VLLNLLRTPNADALTERAVQDAQRLYLEHSMAAEHHAALASMYMARTQRLSDPVPTNVKPIQKGKAA